MKIEPDLNKMGIDVYNQSVSPNYRYKNRYRFDRGGRVKGIFKMLDMKIQVRDTCCSKIKNQSQISDFLTLGSINM